MSFYPPHPTAASFRHTLRSFAQSESFTFPQVLTAERIDAIAEQENVSFGTGPNDIYTVAITLWTFLAQVASSSKCCVAAVSRLLVLLTTLGRPACHSGTGTYCKARKKLPERFLQRLTCEVGAKLEDKVPTTWRWYGRRVVLIDGSTLSMPDTPANQLEYPQSRSQRPGVGFPIARWVALLGLATGTVLATALGPWRGKGTGETALLRTLLASLSEGDVIVADRYYCSYWLIAMAQARGIQVVFRQHQLRHTDFRRGQFLGQRDHVVTWDKPARPRWMNKETYVTIASTLTLREGRIAISTPGCRVHQLTVVTTFTNPQEYSLEDITDLYHLRWNVELDLRSIKTHMNMEILSCKTPGMVRKEIWAHLLAYNLVRQVMAQAALQEDLRPRQLSFKGALQTLAEHRTVLLMVTNADLPTTIRAILVAIATHRVGDRPDRQEPRKIKRRPKGYSRLLQPRNVERAKLMKK